uniref:CAAX farnesyltransferase subunit beta n=1 Tax=Plectus sambesii TaxID=2011161 RepID=A0A914VBD0_9BILA
MMDKIVMFLKTCEGREGGYGGGPGQLPHLATTYAAVMALCTIGTENAYQSINRETLKGYLKAMKISDGGFRMHACGEADIRGAYCAFAVASLTNLMDEALIDKSAEWLV